LLPGFDIQYIAGINPPNRRRQGRKERAGSGSGNKAELVPRVLLAGFLRPDLEGQHPVFRGPFNYGGGGRVIAVDLDDPILAGGRDPGMAAKDATGIEYRHLVANVRRVTVNKKLSQIVGRIGGRHRGGKMGGGIDIQGITLPVLPDRRQDRRQEGRTHRRQSCVQTDVRAGDFPHTPGIPDLHRQDIARHGALIDGRRPLIIAIHPDDSVLSRLLHGKPAAQYPLGIEKGDLVPGLGVNAVDAETTEIIRPGRRWLGRCEMGGADPGPELRPVPCPRKRTAVGGNNELKRTAVIAFRPGAGQTVSRRRPGNRPSVIIITPRHLVSRLDQDHPGGP